MRLLGRKTDRDLRPLTTADIEAPNDDETVTPTAEDPRDADMVESPPGRDDDTVTHVVEDPVVVAEDSRDADMVESPPRRDDETVTHVAEAPVAVAERPHDTDVRESPPTHDEEDRADFQATARVLKTPTFSLLAPLAGWLVAWGTAAVAAAALVEAGVGLGFGFGIADGSVDLDTGFWAGLWTLVVQGGAFLFGGYVAGRMARARATTHAILAWVFAMVATAADAIIVASRDGGSSVLEPLRLPQWAGLDYSNAVAVPLVIFALGSLLAVLIGGILASGANKLDSRDSMLTSSR